MEKFNNWNVNDYEANINKTCFIDYLFFLKDHGRQNEILKVIKASGILLSYKEYININKKNRDKIENFIQSELSERQKKEYYDLVKEAEFLKRKRDIISKKIDEYLEKYKINECDLIKGTCELLDGIDKNINSLDFQYLSTKEYTIFSLGALLKALDYSSTKEFNGIKYALSGEERNKLFNLANALHEINEIIQGWMFGSLEIWVEGEELHINEDCEKDTINKDKIISALNFWDIKDIKDISYSLQKEVGKKSEIEAYQETLKEKVKEYFYTKTFEEKYIGCELKYWIQAYVFFFELARESCELWLYIKKEDLIHSLTKYGIPYEQANEIISIFIFTRVSKDLFDSFLIPYEDNLLFVPKIFLIIDASRAMMSIFGKRGDGSIHQKGNSFEMHLQELIIENSNIPIVSNVKGDLEGENYEIDMVLAVDDKLFICECKTQMQHEDMRGYYRNLKELDFYIDKFKRNIDFFCNNDKGKKILKNKLETIGVKVPQVNNIYFIFISNIYFPRVLYDNIFITDEANIYRFIMRTPSCLYEVCGKEIKIYRLFADLYEGRMDSTQLIACLENKQKEIEISKRRLKLWKNPSLEQFGIYANRFIVDNERII